MKTLAALALTLAAVGAQADVVLTNTFNGSGISPLAYPDTTTYGEVFTTPDAINTVLDSFSLIVRSQNGNTSYLYAGVATWVNGGAGTPLFTSSEFSGHFDDWQEIDIGTGGIALTPGQQYVAYFSTASLPAGNNASLEMGLSNDTNTLGFAYDNAGGGSPLHANWAGCQANCNTQVAGTLEFSAPIQQVPEPTSVALLGLGLLGAGVARRRSQAKTHEPELT
ncbi:MAG: PEP-CTERM sorting domain-containing protein [Proteobacteria bacterium]|nr:PEP-CTERM sorting domain-containing protein [Pseudomonadota bacterium]